jgi:plastocyanin
VRTSRFAIASAATLAAAVAATLALAAGASHEVTIEGMQFQPASLTVERGDTVTWKNADMVPHTATAKGQFDSGYIGPGKSYSRRMEQAGEFDYVCKYHPGMHAKLVVR